MTNNSDKASYKDKSVIPESNDVNVDTVLNDIGRKQSRLVAKTLEPVQFTHAFCSPLKRALQTYDEIARYHPKLDCEVHAGLQEYHCGRLQGITRRQAFDICDKEGITYEVFRGQAGAESREHVFARLDRFWKTEIVPLRKTDALVLLVSHGGVISTLRNLLIKRLGYQLHESLTRRGVRDDIWEVKNCSITEIILEGDKGPGEFIRLGEWEHLVETSYDLENSTG